MGLPSPVTATRWRAGSRPARSRAAHTSRSLVRVSRVVPLLLTMFTRVRDRSSPCSTSAASSGSTLAMKRAERPSTACALRARYRARGPRSEPPMPTCTMVVKDCPRALTSRPRLRSWRKARSLSSSARARVEASGAAGGSANTSRLAVCSTWRFSLSNPSMRLSTAPPFMARKVSTRPASSARACRASMTSSLTRWVA